MEKGNPGEGTGVSTCSEDRRVRCQRVEGVLVESCGVVYHGSCAFPVEDQQPKVAMEEEFGSRTDALLDAGLNRMAVRRVYDEQSKLPMRESRRRWETHQQVGIVDQRGSFEHGN